MSEQRKRRYRYSHGQEDGGEHSWYIVFSEKGYFTTHEEVVFSLPFLEEHWGLDEPPIELRAEYERLLKEDGFVGPEPTVNIVEMIAADEAAFNQPCAFGNCVEGHAVYCHNETWLYSPRKCRRTWSTGGKIRDEDCPGYKPNPNYSAPHDKAEG